MSATNRGAERRPLEAYYTPDPLAVACVNTLNLFDEVVLEPHAGGGAFIRALQRPGLNMTVWAMDIDPQAPAMASGACPNRMCGDFLKTQPSDFWPDAVPDWVLGNPPFNEAEAHVRRAISVAREGVGFLLRLAFLEGVKRRAFWKENPPYSVHVLVQRPSFTGGGTDSAAYGWFVWRKFPNTEGPTLDWLDWKEGS